MRTDKTFVNLNVYEVRYSKHYLYYPSIKSNLAEYHSKKTLSCRVFNLHGLWVCLDNEALYVLKLLHFHKWHSHLLEPRNPITKNTNNTNNTNTTIKQSSVKNQNILYYDFIVETDLTNNVEETTQNNLDIKQFYKFYDECSTPADISIEIRLFNHSTKSVSQIDQDNWFKYKRDQSELNKIINGNGTFNFNINGKKEKQSFAPIQSYINQSIDIFEHFDKMEKNEIKTKTITITKTKNDIQILDDDKVKVLIIILIPDSYNLSYFNCLRHIILQNNNTFDIICNYYHFFTENGEFEQNMNDRQYEQISLVTYDDSAYNGMQIAKKYNLQIYNLILINPFLNDFHSHQVFFISVADSTESVHVVFFKQMDSVFCRNAYFEQFVKSKMNNIISETQTSKTIRIKNKPNQLSAYHYYDYENYENINKNLNREFKNYSNYTLFSIKNINSDGELLNLNNKDKTHQNQNQNQKDNYNGNMSSTSTSNSTGMNYERLNRYIILDSIYDNFLETFYSQLRREVCNNVYSTNRSIKQVHEIEEYKSIMKKTDQVSSHREEINYSQFYEHSLINPTDISIVDQAAVTLNTTATQTDSYYELNKDNLKLNLELLEKKDKNEKKDNEYNENKDQFKDEKVNVVVKPSIVSNGMDMNKNNMNQMDMDMNMMRDYNMEANMNMGQMQQTLGYKGSECDNRSMFTSVNTNMLKVFGENGTRNTTLSEGEAYQAELMDIKSIKKKLIFYKKKYEELKLLQN